MKKKTAYIILAVIAVLAFATVAAILTLTRDTAQPPADTADTTETTVEPDTEPVTEPATETNDSDVTEDGYISNGGQEDTPEFMPDEAARLLFTHRIFGTDITLLGYRTEPKSICVYYTSDSKTYKKLDLSLPQNMSHRTAEAFHAAPGGGSGEAVIYIELTEGSDIYYTSFDNFSSSAPLQFSARDSMYTSSELFDLYGEMGLPIQFPNAAMPKSADIIAELDRLGLPEDDPRLQYINAFLSRDVRTLEKLCSVEPGMYDIYSTIELERFVVNVEDTDWGYVTVHFDFKVKSSRLDVLEPGKWYEYIVSEGPNGVFIYRDDDRIIGLSESESALRTMLGCVFFFDLPKTNDMSDSDRWSVTEYLCLKLGIDEYHTAAEIADAAYKIFGIEGFTPDEYHTTDQGVAVHGHGGISRFYTVSLVEPGTDTAVYHVQFYADSSKTIKSHVYEYGMKKTDFGWAFTDSRLVLRGEYEPLQWVM